MFLVPNSFLVWLKSAKRTIMSNTTGFFDEIEENLQCVGGTTGAVALTVAAAAVTYYYSTRPVPEKPLVPLDNQCPIEDGPDQVHVSKFYKEAKDGKYVSCLEDDVRTLYQSFRKGAHMSNNGPCLGWRENLQSPYQWMNFNETLLRAKNFGSGLISLGLRPGPNTYIGIYSQNRPEWILFEQGCYCYSLVVVPLYDTLGPDACAFIVDQAEMQVVVVEDDKKVNLLLDKAPRSLRKIVAIKEVRPATLQRAKNVGIDVHSFDEVEKMGAINDHPELEPQPDDLCTVCYTSGTTGNPKGVMLTHANVLSGVTGVLLQLGTHRPRVGDVMVSFLPLAHMLERCCENGVYYMGGAVGFFSGDIKELTNDLKALKPTLMPAVPRLLNRVYDKVFAEVSRSSVKKLLLNMALSSKEAEIKRGIVRRNSIWDKLVFRKIQEGFGGRLRLMVVGSAPLSDAVLAFSRAALGCLICEGYGQTECTAPITLTVQGDFVAGHVGPPVACNAIKLVDVPEMEYYASQQQGEICVRGANVFIGYLKDPQRTAETIDKEGWHHTGDIGQWLPNGTLKVIDRKKHIFKLSQGEYIVPEKIENAYIRSQYVEQVFVHGESLKSCIVAIVVPDVEVIKSWAQENNIPGTLSVLCNNPDVKQLILNDMTLWGKEFGLKSFEQVKDIYLHPDPFSVQNGLLTPTFKSRRPQIRSYFAPQLDDMYKHLD
ncbi:long-chain-fatty-acid--CoA ligase 1 isoform X1 [Anopheles ziemanni]|uniref:long-chain-fatty-acid--CoA ligase 1 isoform X1 n=1 Tax=Anopheles coustani TaxID=139045 RepID=UPI0026584A42|nr:long-chain-fatty-acid--CoA ligase 1 isoform X1 [Anopheles coustani]XP_058130222.1 long-chain-fatty-acid--CoA ligase 1 isoform X1 [Anopheles coustani]XP_058130223.1 long-chain-fatty-acid--CoA ligase 1 isoform X1 [Anopheles coustani]XP_058175179.1 long-chain-fatty-acid--CoA ligase 1 isoform X1 [Anopheles ziemanni]